MPKAPDDMMLLLAEESIAAKNLHLVRRCA